MRNVTPTFVAYLMVAHAVVGCCSHHQAKADDACPPACACSNERTEIVPASCECTHHPHDRATACNSSHCVYTKNEKIEKQSDHATPVQSTDLRVDLTQPIRRRFGIPTVAESASARRYLLF